MKLKQRFLKSFEFFPGLIFFDSELNLFDLALWVWIVCLPFNLAFHFFDKYAYLDGFFVNYLDFVVHIVDLANVLVISIVLIRTRIIKERWFRIAVAISIVAFFAHNLIFRDLVVVYYSARLIIVVLAIFSIIHLIQKNKINLKKIVYPLVFIGIVQASIAVMQFLLNRTLGLNFLGESQVQAGGFSASSVYLNGSFRLRGYGTFPHPNVLGGFLSIVLMFLFNEIWKVNGVIKKLPIVAAVAFIVLGLISTWSRSALLITGLVFLLIFGKKMWEKSNKFSALVLSILGFGFLTVFLIFGSRGRSLSYSQRMQLLDQSIKLLKKQPLVGVGLGNYLPSVVDNPIVMESGIRLVQPVHNIFLLFLNEIGVIGFIGFIAGVYFFIKLKYFNEIKMWKFAGFAIFVLIAGLLDHYLLTLPQGLGLWILLIIWLKS